MRKSAKHRDLPGRELLLFFALSFSLLVPATLAPAGEALPDLPGTLAEPVAPMPPKRDPGKSAAGKPAASPRPAAPKPGKQAAKPAPKKPLARKVAPKKKNAPVNAGQVAGLYTVDRQGRGVFYRKGLVLGVGINVIEADLSDPQVRVAAMIAEGGIGTAERFHEMVRRAQPTAAITGTFFGVRNRIPTGDLVINGNAVFRGFVGTAVAITEGNVVSFITTKYKDQSVDWSLFDTVIRGGPRLIEGGRIVMAPRSEGFRTLPISKRRTRTAVGLTRDNRLQFVAVRQQITLWELAKVMRAIGAYHAVALDGGTSTALYFAGNHVANPGRGLTNALLIYHRREQFERMRHQFAGGYMPKPPPAAPAPPPNRLPFPGFEPAQDLDFPVRREVGSGG